MTIISICYRLNDHCVCFLLLFPLRRTSRKRRMFSSPLADSHFPGASRTNGWWSTTVIIGIYMSRNQSLSLVSSFVLSPTRSATMMRWPRSSRCPSERCAGSTVNRSPGKTSTRSAYRRWRLWSRTQTTATSPPKTTTVIRNWIWNFRNEAAKACWPKYEVLCAATTPQMGFFNQILWNGKLCTRFCVSWTSSWTRRFPWSFQPLSRLVIGVKKVFWCYQAVDHDILRFSQ